MGATASALASQWRGVIVGAMPQQPRSFAIASVDVEPDGGVAPVRTGPATAVPSRFVAYLELADPELRVAVRIRVTPGGSPAVEEMHVWAGDRTPLTSGTLRKVLLDPIARAAMTAAAQPVTERPDIAPGAYQIEGEAEHQAWVSAPAGATDRVRQVARLYTEALTAGSKSPGLDAANAVHISRAQAARYIKRAREGCNPAAREDSVPKIKTVTLGDGSKRYRFTVDIGRDPETGKRQQKTMTFRLQREAAAELARIGHETRTGAYVKPWNGTLDELLDDWYRSATYGKEANTLESYSNALKPARERLGHRKAQTITRQDIEDLRDWMETRGRKRGGKPGTGLGPRAVRLTLGRLRAAFEQACDDGKLYRNPCRGVELPEMGEREYDTWSADQVRVFLAAAAQDRLHAAWRITLYGLRRAEVCGLRWSDVDLQDGMLTVAVTRPVVSGKPIVKKPKSKRGARTLPLDAAVVAALQAMQDRQVTEAMEAGDAYAASGYVVTDELGEAVNPEWYSDEFHRLRERAGLPRIRLHDSRHTANSLMAAGWRTGAHPRPPGADRLSPSTRARTRTRGRRIWPPRWPL